MFKIKFMSYYSHNYKKKSHNYEKRNRYYEKKSRYYEKNMSWYWENYVTARVVWTLVTCLVVLVRRDDPHIKQVPVLKMLILQLSHRNSNEQFKSIFKSLWILFNITMYIIVIWVQSLSTFLLIFAVSK